MTEGGSKCGLDASPEPASPTPTEPFLAAGIRALIGFIVALGLAAVILVHFPRLPTTLQFWISMAPMHIAGLGTALFWLRSNVPQGALAETLQLRREDARAGQLALRAGRVLLVAYPATLGIRLVTCGLVALAGHTPEASPIIKLLMNDGPTPALLASVGIAVVLVAPVAEEILFRLLFYETLSLRCDARTSAILTSLAFALAHQTPEEVPALFVLGMVLQRTRERSGGLWLPMAVHMGFNAISFLLLLAARAAGVPV